MSVDTFGINYLSDETFFRGSAMSIINNVGPTDSVQRIINNPISKTIPADAAGTTPPPVADSLELSGASGYLQTLQANNIRGDKVAQVKAQIEAGTYETPDKLDSAINKLLDSGEIN
jgi:anti-sigma28 factor (negative regulator of flagellin synthesis)